MVWAGLSTRWIPRGTSKINTRCGARRSLRTQGSILTLRIRTKCSVRALPIASKGRRMQLRRGGINMANQKLRYPLITAGVGVLFFLAVDTEPAFAHKDKHTAEQLQAFEEVFMEQVKIGVLLFPGDPETQKRLNVNLSILARPAPCATRIRRI